VALDPQTKNFLTQLAAKNRILETALIKIQKDHEQLLAQLESQPRSISEEIDSIPGRRIFYNFVGAIDFTIAQLRLRGEPINFLVSQDGPFVATHYPWAAWKPNAPTAATNFGQWSPVSSWPLPTQQSTGQDRIDLSYEVIDGGSQRNFQNAAAGPVFSRPDNIIPLPCPTLFAPNTVIQIFPTYENILFDGSVDEETTGGELVFVIPGYKVVNM
jgi:hypothetical protein